MLLYTYYVLSNNPINTKLCKGKNDFTTCFFKGQPRSLFHLFSAFSNKQYNFKTNQCEKMSCPSSIRCQDSNPRPLDHESSLIITRPALPPTLQLVTILAGLHSVALLSTNNNTFSLFGRFHPVKVGRDQPYSETTYYYNVYEWCLFG